MANENLTGKFNSLDDLIRRKLRVSDPSKAEEVTKALLKQYPFEKVKLDQEASGLQVIFEPQVTIIQEATVNPTEDELAQANLYLDQDIDAVIHEPVFRSFSTNLEGFAGSIKNATGEGVSAARSSFDSIQRDKVFSIRGILSDYARLARRIGMISPDTRYKCRSLARDIDWIASLMLVLAGEAISKQALKGFLIQISIGEMEARRDAVINALRNLLGTIEAGYDDETWGRRTLGCMDIYDEIERNNQQDLKVLFQEPELSKMLGELIEQIARDNVTGVGAFAPAVESIIAKFQRLNVISKSMVNIEPPLTAFLNELNLFSQIVLRRDNRVGMRLIDISRSGITFYGNRFGSLLTDDIDMRIRLISLTFERSRLAELIDRNANQPRQIMEELDQKISYIDRAIDHYTLGTQNFGASENCAYAYWILINTYLQGSPDPDIDKDITGRLGDILKQLDVPVNQQDQDAINLETRTQELADDRYQQMVNLMIPNNLCQL